MTLTGFDWSFIYVNVMQNLSQQKCVPCEVKVPPFDRVKAREYLKEVPGWKLDDSGTELKLKRAWKFSDFKQALGFVNKIAQIAEGQGHHPDIFVHYNEVTLTLWTHFIGGLFDNDFILAAKMNEIL